MKYTELFMNTGKFKKILKIFWFYLHKYVCEFEKYFSCVRKYRILFLFFD